MTTWGIDYTFDATGNTEIMRAALGTLFTIINVNVNVNYLNVNVNVSIHINVNNTNVM